MDEKEYIKGVRDYKNNHLSPLRQKDITKLVKDKLKEGKSWKWIYTALTYKSVENWEVWGFGLMFNDSYIKQIDEILEEEETEEDFDDFLFSLGIEVEDDEPTPEFNPAPKPEPIPAPVKTEIPQDTPKDIYIYMDGYPTKPYSLGCCDKPQAVLRKEVREQNIPAIQYALENEVLSTEAEKAYSEFLDTREVPEWLLEKYPLMNN